eukprot:3715040-Prymnesium_polylepis.1
MILADGTPVTEHTEASLPLGCSSAIVAASDTFGARAAVSTPLCVTAPVMSAAETNAYLLDALDSQVGAADQLQDSEAQVKIVASLATLL